MTSYRTVQSWGAVLLLPFAVACGTTEADEAPTVQSAVVERGDLMITAEATGSVEPVRKVEVKSKASGEILRLHVDIGDRVEPGALLAEIDPRDVRNASEQTEADLDVAQARLDIALAQLGRSEELLASGVISVQEHESKNLEYANAQATLVKAKTNNELAQLRLQDVTIRAPMAGTVLEKNVEEGQVIQSASQNVSGGTVLLVMANLQEMQVRTLVDETDMGEIRDGMRAIVTVEAYPDRPFVGEVEKIEPQAVVQQNVTMFPVIVRLDNSSRLLKPGMNAEVEVEIAEAPSVLLIPNAAVVTPQEAVPAGMVLGLPEDAIDVRSMFAGMGGGRGGGPGFGGQPSPGGAQDRPVAGRGGGGQAGFDSIRARVARGEISQDSARAIFQRQRSASGGQGGFRPEPGPGAGSGGFLGDKGEAGVGAVQESRRAVLFVIGEDGVIEPRAVMIGLNDWDYTQVVSGVEEGEQVALIGAAQLRATQDAFLERIRSRSSPFGGGGPGSGGGRGRR
jgi:HlyD family secretion protein